MDPQDYSNLAYNATYDEPDDEHYYEEIPPIEREIEYNSLHTELPKVENHIILKINKCPSLNAALNLLPIVTEKFLAKFSSSTSIEFKIIGRMEDFHELNNFNLFKNFKEFKKTFLISFESIADGSCSIFWRLRNKTKIYSVKIDKNTAEVGKFVRNFLLVSLKSGHNGKF